ncbi:MAG: class I lanthipeptide [Hyalangium sp.]|uniref:class I lanthipeptide n=1 Tax=Hyalangium sp. TaxID=2028555 RepID=UPI00389B3402
MKKLQLKKETLKVLTDEKLDQVRGGAATAPVPVPVCCAYSKTAIDSCKASVSCTAVTA